MWPFKKCGVKSPYDHAMCVARPGHMGDHRSWCGYSWTQQSVEEAERLQAAINRLAPPQRAVLAPAAVPMRPQARTSEILAWRAWRIQRCGMEDFRLLSVTRDIRWDSPRLVADKEPDPAHEHGIYALAKPDRPVYQSYGIDHGYRYKNPVHGVVALSGIVLEGERGYRAHQAMVRALWLNMGVLAEMHDDLRPIEVMAAMEERYQCPVSVAQHDEAVTEILEAMKDKAAA